MIIWDWPTILSIGAALCAAAAGVLWLMAPKKRRDNNG